jgi:hypothetical protein
MSNKMNNKNSDPGVSMTTTRVINLPILTDGNRVATSGQFRGTVATGAVTGALGNLPVDEGSLSDTLRAALDMATVIDGHARADNAFRLSELQISLGVSTTGKVGFLGTGVDVGCEATFTVVLTRSE